MLLTESTNPSAASLDQTVIDAAEVSQIRAARDGDEEAFNELARRYTGPLYRFLLLHAKREADAKDALQETWLAVVRYFHTYKLSMRFNTWLYSIAMRKLPRERAAVLRLFDWNSEETEDVPSPLDVCLGEEGRGNLWRLAARALDRERLSALWFYYGCDLSVPEIAAILDRSDSWVKVNLHRSRGRLRDHLKEQDDAN